MQEQWREGFAERAAEYWTEARTYDLTRGKELAILPGEAPVLLRALGLLHRDASMPPPQVRKYRQINHMVAVLRPAMMELCERAPVVRIFDAGCGRSYLTVLLAWVFVHRYHHPVQIVGVDRNAELIEECRRRTELAELTDVLRYRAGLLEDISLDEVWAEAFGEAAPVNALVSLHACDTATDDAIALGVREGVDLVAVAPCCQAELAARWAALADAGEAGAFAPVWSTPHLRRNSAATITDMFRTLLLRAAGYDAAAIEFVASAHTPKNTLIRAMKRAECDAAAAAEYAALQAATGGVGIGLADAILGGA